LKNLKKYDGQWRKVYTIRVTMKSGITKEPRVMMDKDGLTPRIMEKDIEKILDDFSKKTIEAERILWKP